MASRRTARILLVVGVILILVGIGALVVGSTPGSVSETDFIPAGWENVVQFQWGTVAGGTVQGTWQSGNATPVQVLVYNDADYNAYLNGANLTGLYNVTGTSGTIALSVPGFNTYHVVVQHPAAYENLDQNVTVSLTTTGADPTFTIGGAVAAVLGVAAVAFSVRRLRAPETPQGILPSRATIGTPAPPGGYDTSTGGTGMYRVPPPLPGGPGNPPEYPGTRTPPTVSYPSGATAPVAAAATDAPVGTVVVAVENGSPAEVGLDLLVNGVAVTSMTVPSGGSRQVSVSAKLASPFGSTVTVEAVMAGGRRASQAVFVGAKGTAPVTLRIG